MHRFYPWSHFAPCLAIAVALLAIPPVLACSCVPPPPPLEAAERATVVFVGKPVAELPGGGKNSAYARRFEFAVDEILAGTGKATLVVGTARDSGACGCYFEIGVSYVVYAHGEMTALQTNLCTRTKRLDAKGAADEVALLREAKAGKRPAK